MKVLLVCNDRDFPGRLSYNLKTMLSTRIELVHALNINGAEEQLLQNQDVTAIAIDISWPGTSPDALSATRKLRKAFRGPMIAISHNRGCRELLMEAGCDNESIKDELIWTLSKVLNI